MKHKKIKINKNFLITSLSILFILTGIIIFLYPAISNFIAEHNQAEVIQNYDEALSSIDEETLQKEWELAKEYNENLNGDPVHDPFVPGSGYAIPNNYNEVLNIDEVMCYLEIPKIKLKLPVYHGTSEEVLEKGVGHLEYTALPIGGESRLSVLTGHRGLPSAELFTRLDELEIGDYFYINVLDKTLTYKVDKIDVIEPDQLESLTMEPEKDLITLLTCTPYGVNTHRLLVRGERTDYVPPSDIKPDTSVQILKQINRWQPYQIWTIIVMVIIILILLIIWKLKSNRTKKG